MRQASKRIPDSAEKTVRDTRQADRAAVAMGKWMRGEAHWFDPTGLS
jgi:hypothetical protein